MKKIIVAAAAALITLSGCSSATNMVEMTMEDRVLFAPELYEVWQDALLALEERYQEQEGASKKLQAALSEDTWDLLSLAFETVQDAKDPSSRQLATETLEIAKRAAEDEAPLELGVFWAAYSKTVDANKIVERELMTFYAGTAGAEKGVTALKSLQSKNPGAFDKFQTARKYLFEIARKEWDDLELSRARYVNILNGSAPKGASVSQAKEKYSAAKDALAKVAPQEWSEYIAATMEIRRLHPEVWHDYVDAKARVYVR